MHGDFTRDSFDPKRHYSGVRHQQGRVQLDADFNEQADIGLYLERTANADIIDTVGAPYANPGDFVHFKIDGGSLETLQVAPGHIYVDGVLVENEETVSLDDQPDLPANAPIVRLNDGSLVTLADAPSGQYAVILHVAERHVTAIEEPSLREVALGPHGPDTTTRVQTVWQVRLRQTPGGFNCVSAQNLLPNPSRGRLTSSVQAPAPATDPCEPGGAGGYRGLENQLYRVEIHEGGARGTATFKWSRENGSVVVAVDDFIEEPAGIYTKVQVSTLGRDDVLGLAETNWVELVDEHTVQLGRPGTLAQIVDIKPAVGGGYVIELSKDVASHVPPGEDPAVRHPRLRRWDQTQGLQPDGTILTAAGPIDLELGVRVEFPEVPAGDEPEFRTDDYWVFAARASTGEVEKLADAPPRGSKRYALLALVDWDGANLTDDDIHDCRPIFPPTTDMVQLLYVGGDGQQGPGGVALPAPLQVSVARGRFPVPGARVQFEITAGGGSVTPMTATTDAEGVASCDWTLGAADLQSVEARLLLPDGSDAPNPPVRFSAVIATEIERQGGCCCVIVGPGEEFEDLDEALNTLLEEGRPEICLCLMVGEYELRGLQVERDPGDALHIHIKGCGPGTRVHLSEQLWMLRGVTSFHMEDVAIQTDFPARGPALWFNACDEVVFTGCHIAGPTSNPGDIEARGMLLSISNTASVRLRDLRMEAFTSVTFGFLRDRLEEIGLEAIGAGKLKEAFESADKGAEDFLKVALLAGDELASLDVQAREELVKGLGTLELAFSALEWFHIHKLRVALASLDREPDDYAAILLDIRRAAIKTRPGVALVLGMLSDSEIGFNELDLGPLDWDSLISVESCEIAGQVGLYGLPVRPDVFLQEVTEAKLKLIEQQIEENGLPLDGDPIAFKRPISIGTLAMRGNQIACIGFPKRIIEALSESFGGGVIGFFNELLLSDNVFEHEPIVTAAIHNGLANNQFLARQIGDEDEPVAIIFGQSAVYTGNRGEGRRLLDITQIHGEAANVQLNIV